MKGDRPMSDPQQPKLDPVDPSKKLTATEAQCPVCSGLPYEDLLAFTVRDLLRALCAEHLAFLAARAEREQLEPDADPKTGVPYGDMA